jgi:hypothetical protein
MYGVEFPESHDWSSCICVEYEEVKCDVSE